MPVRTYNLIGEIKKEPSQRFLLLLFDMEVVWLTVLGRLRLQLTEIKNLQPVTVDGGSRREERKN
jgi:hypothetical protein